MIFKQLFHSFCMKVKKKKKIVQKEYKFKINYNWNIKKCKSYYNTWKYHTLQVQKPFHVKLINDYLSPTH